MKLNLLMSSDETLGGYINVDPFAPESSVDKVGCPVHKLDEIADDAEAEEIRAIEILEYYPPIDSEKLINHWLKKLKHGGKLVIGIIDLMEVAHGVSNFKLTPDEANLFLYGEQTQPWQQRKTIFAAPQIATYLVSKGMHISKIRTKDYRSVIEAERP